MSANRTSRPTDRIIKAYALSLGHVLAIRISQQLPDFHALVSLDPRNFRARVVGQAPADLHRLTLPHLAIRTRSRPALINNTQTHGLLLSKEALDVDHADGKQAGLTQQCLVRALVDVQSAVWTQAVQDPEVAVADGRGGGQEPRVEGDLATVNDGLGMFGARGGGAGNGTIVERGERCGGRVVDLGGERGWGAAALDVLDDLVDIARVGGAGNHGGDAGGGGEPGGYDLGGHAASAERGAGLRDWKVEGQISRLFLGFRLGG